MKKHYTDSDVRAEIRKRLAGRSQAAVAREIGISPQNLSVMVRGGSLHGKVLAWLGFRRVEGLFEKR